MKILYGVAGEGSGHSMRAREIIAHLRKNHIVKVMTYDTAYRNLSPDFDCEKIEGLRLAYNKNNELIFTKTVWRNIVKFKELLYSFDKVKRIVNEFKPDIMITDFEPMTAWAARAKKIKLISIDNQHRLTNAKIVELSRFRFSALSARLITRLFVPKADVYFITSFHALKIKKPASYIFPPILRQEVLNAKTSESDYILVYLTAGFDSVVKVLKKTTAKFIVYGFDKDEVDANIIYKKASRENFLSDLCACRAVVATAGFTLLTECLHLGKPMLAIPVSKQYEQMINAYYLSKLKYGSHCRRLSVKRLNKFLRSLDVYKEALRRYERKDNSEIINALERTLNIEHCA